MIPSSFSVFAAHSRWAAAEISSLVPGAFSMTILREPLEAFESFYSYMNIDRSLDLDINQFAQNLTTRQESDMSLDVKEEAMRDSPLKLLLNTIFMKSQLYIECIFR